MERPPSRGKKLALKNQIMDAVLLLSKNTFKSLIPFHKRNENLCLKHESEGFENKYTCNCCLVCSYVTGEST